MANKSPSSQSCGFSSSHVLMWELDYKESWAPKNWCFWTVVLEKTLESPLDHKDIKPVSPQGNQSWIFIWGTDAEAETLILWSPDPNWLNLTRPWCWEILKAGREGDDRGWDRWMVLLTWWTWVWASFGSWWYTGKPGVLHAVLGITELDMTEELNWKRTKERTEINNTVIEMENALEGFNSRIT